MANNVRAKKRALFSHRYLNSIAIRGALLRIVALYLYTVRRPYSEYAPRIAECPTLNILLI